MRKILALSAIMGTAAYILAKLRIKPRKARSKRATFAELYEDNICDLDGLFG